jgi:hypothetical protein
MSNADTPIPFVAEFDPQSWYTVGNRRVTPTIAGYYNISYSAWWAAGTLSNVQQNVQALKNTNTVSILQTPVQLTSGISQSATKIEYLNGTTDYITFSGYSANTGGGTLQKGNGLGSGTSFSVSLIQAGGPTGPQGPPGVPAWISTGPIVFSATTTAPTASTNAPVNNMSYRQLGTKEWEVSLTYQFGTNAGVTGSGDYIFTLPNSLSFDTSLPMQRTYQGSVTTSTWVLTTYVLPASGMINNTGVGGSVYPIPWSSTQFRILVTTYGSSVQCWGSGYYQISTTAGGINMRFSFTST